MSSDLGLLTARIELDSTAFKVGADGVRASTEAIVANEDRVSRSVEIATTSLADQRRELGLVDSALEATARKTEQLSKIASSVAVAAISGADIRAVYQSSLPIEKPSSVPVGSAVPGTTGNPEPIQRETNRDDAGGGLVGDVATHLGASYLARQSLPLLIKHAPMAASSLSSLTGVGLGTAVALGTTAAAVAGLVVALPALAAAGEFADYRLSKFSQTVEGLRDAPALSGGDMQTLSSAAQSQSLGSEKSYTDLGKLAGATVASREEIVGSKATSSISDVTAVEAAAASLPIVEKFATITGLDDEQAAKSQAKLIAGYQVRNATLAESIGFQTRLNDVIARGSQLTGDGPQKLTADLTKAAPAAEAVGWSLTQTTVALAAFADRGIAADQLGSSLEELRLVGAANRDAFADYGIVLTDSSGRLAGADKIAREVSVGMRGLDQEQRAAQLSALGLSLSTANMVATLSMVPANVEAARDSIANATGAASESARTLKEDYATAWNANTSAISSMGQSIGSAFNVVKEAALTPILEQVGTAATTAASAVQWGSDHMVGAANAVHAAWSKVPKPFEAAKQLAASMGIIDPPKISDEIRPPKPITVELTADEKKLAATDLRTDSVKEHEQRIRLLDAALASGSLKTHEHANAARVHREAIDAATGGTAKMITELDREIASLGLSTAAREAEKLALKGASAEQAAAVVAKQAEKTVADEMNSLRERSIALIQTESEQRRAALADKGVSTEDAAAIEGERTRIGVQEELQRLSKERIALGQTEAEQRQQSLTDKGYDAQSVAFIQASEAQNAAIKDRLALQKEIDELTTSKSDRVAKQQVDAGYSDADRAEIKALREKRDAIKSEQEDRKKASEIAERVDPTITLRKEREEAERLRSVLGEDAYAKHVADIEKRWQSATGAAAGHRAELLKGLEGVAAYDSVFSQLALDESLKSVPQMPAFDPIVAPAVDPLRVAVDPIVAPAVDPLRVAVDPIVAPAVDPLRVAVDPIVAPAVDPIMPPEIAAAVSIAPVSLPAPSPPQAPTATATEAAPSNNSQTELLKQVLAELTRLADATADDVVRNTRDAARSLANLATTSLSGA